MTSPGERRDIATPRGPLSVEVLQPDGSGPFPAIVLSSEAFGITEFMRDVAIMLADNGFVTIMPDYYRGSGPADPEDFLDLTEVFHAIDQLDFRLATYDIIACADWLRAQTWVDATRVGTWGYCTGGTLSLLHACLDRHLATAVLFYPSQPVFEKLDGRHPAHPIDLVWNIACPVQVHYGSEDYLMPLPRINDLGQRLRSFDIMHELHVYPGARHSFSCKNPEMHDPDASRLSLSRSLAFAKLHMALA